MRRFSRPALLLAATLSVAPIFAETIDTTSGDITRATPINDGTLIKNGTGNLTLTGANTLTGEVSVNDGTLAINHADALSGATPVTVNATKQTAPVTFTSVGGTLTFATSLTLAGVTIPAGQYAVTNPTTLTSQADSSLVYSFPGSSAKNGALTLNTAVAGLAVVKVLGGAVNGPGSLSAETLFLRNGTVSATLAGATRVVIGEESETAIVLPATAVGGPAILSGNNTYTGGTVVNSGTLEARTAGALGTGDITVYGTNGTGLADTTLTLPVSFNTPTGTTGGSGNAYTGSATVSAGNLLVGSGGLTHDGSGTLTLSGSNTYSGGTILLDGGAGAPGVTIPNTGTLVLSAAVVTPGNLVLAGGFVSGDGSLGASNFDVRAGTVTAKLTGSGALVKSGSGAVWLAGANDYTGGTTVQAGRLEVANTGTLAGPVAVNGGLLMLHGDRTLSRLDTSAAGQLGVNEGETRVHAGTLAGNIVVAAGAALTLDGTARIAQPAGGHPDNVVSGPNGPETLSTSVLLVHGTLNLIGNDHALGLVTGTGDIRLSGGATYSLTASNFTGGWFLEPTTPTDPTPGGDPAPRPSATGGFRMDGSLWSSGDMSSPTNRVQNLNGSGTLTIISDWTGYDTINLGAGITINLGQGESHSVDASLVQIAPGATLRGLGSITGSVVNDGRIAPGNSPGVITLGGDFTNGPAGVVDIEVAGVNPGTGYDVIRYAGQAVLNGGTLNVTLLGGFTPGAALRVHFLEDTDLANGSPSVTGAFATVNLPANLYTRLVTDGSGMSAFVSPVLAGMPGVSVSSALLGADRAAGANPVIQAALQTTYAASGGAAAGAALRAVSPIGFGALPGMSLDAARDDVRTITDRAGAHRALALSKSDPWETYVGYTGRFSEAKSGVNAPVYDSTIQSGHVGLEKTVAESFIVGLTPAYSRGEATLAGGAGKIDMDRAAVTGYAAYAEADTVAQLGLRAGYLNFDTKRTHILGTDKADTDGFELGAFAGVSHALRVGDFVITPEASLGYTYAEIGGFGESGSAAALRVRSVTQDSLRARVGSSFDWLPVNDAGSTLALGLGVGAEQELLKQHADIRAAYAGGSAFDTAAAMGARTTLDVGPQIAWTFDTTNAIRAGYRYEYGFDETVSHRVDVSYSKRF